MPSVTYVNFDLHIEPTGTGYRAIVTDSPAGSASTEFTLPFSDKDLKIFVLEVMALATRPSVRRVEDAEMATVKEFGTALFETVFSGPVRERLASSLDEVERPGARIGLRLRLRLSNSPSLLNVPWEYVHHPDRGFLGLSYWTPIIRYLDLPRPPRPLTVDPPLRILAAISNPGTRPRLDVDREWSKLEEALGKLAGRGRVVLERLPTPTLEALQWQLLRGEYHVFHFVGHGRFDERQGDGLLLFEDGAGGEDPVTGETVGILLRDHRSLRLAVLNACEGSRTDPTDPFAGTAQSIVRVGTPAVIAMQFEVTDEAAILLSHQFYAAVAEGLPIDAAVAVARTAVATRLSGVEWATPVLYMRSPDGRIFDVTTSQTKEEALEALAREAMAKEDWPGAVELLGRLERLVPGDREVAELLALARTEVELADAYAAGRSLLEQGRAREAIEVLHGVQTRRPGYRNVDAVLTSAIREVARPSPPPTPREPPRAAVSVALDPPSVAVEPGGEGRVQVSVSNTGEIGKRAAIRVGGPVGDWSSLGRSIVEVGPGETASAVLAVRPPPSARPFPEEIEFEVTAALVGFPHAAASTTGVLRVPTLLRPPWPVRFWRKHRPLVVAAGVVAAAVLAVGVVAILVPDLARVPDVGGLRSGAARRAIERAGLTVRLERVPSRTDAAGTVLGTSPTSGAEVDEGSTVRLTVSDGPRIAYVGGVDGARDILLVRPDGQGSRNLTEGRWGDAGEPAWSPTGAWVALSAGRTGSSDADIVALNVLQGDQVVVTHAPGAERNPAWSPDGKSIAYVAADGDLYVVAFEERAVPRRLYPGPAARPAWSPEGDRLVFHRGGAYPGLYLLDASGDEEAERLTEHSEDQSPTWGPDGIAFHGAREGTCCYLYRVDPDTREVTFLGPDPIEGAEPSWSPDGTRLVYHQGSDVVIVKADGSGRRVVITADEGQKNPDPAF